MTAHPVDGIRCAQVEVRKAAEQADLTPVEAVAAFLHDVADLSGIEADLLVDLADQLDPFTYRPFTADPAGRPASAGTRTR